MHKDNLSPERTGAINKNNFGSTMEVVVYNSYKDIWVKFDKGNPIKTTWQNFINGSVRNPYDKTLFGVGYLGEGECKSYSGKRLKEYIIWISMLGRCYDEKLHQKYPTYKECTVTEEWHNFQNFVKWYDENFYQVDGEKMNLDKDILVKGNKVYSPETCIFVPQRINKLFLKQAVKGGRKLPIGVYVNDKKWGKFVATCDDKYLGHFDSPEEAFESYKIAKEKLIKDVAEEYKNKIPEKLYKAMISYIVEIDN
jgi:predicted RNase H-like HicB family nuclease